MKTGTKSILFGAHQFILHPLFVALAWWKLYGFPWDPRLWIAFVVHDWGYWGLKAMDDERGEWHPYRGAKIMWFLFDGRKTERHTFGPGRVYIQESYVGALDGITFIKMRGKWYEFVLYHSRFLAQKENQAPSRLCYADKYSICLTPWWIYVPLVRLTGEIRGYKEDHKHISDLGSYHSGTPTDRSWKADIRWFRSLQQRMREYGPKRKSEGQAGIRQA